MAKKEPFNGIMFERKLTRRERAECYLRARKRERIIEARMKARANRRAKMATLKANAKLSDSISFVRSLDQAPNCKRLCKISTTRTSPIFNVKRTPGSKKDDSVPNPKKKIRVDRSKIKRWE